MSHGNLQLAEKITVLLDDITVTDGGLKAEAAGEVHEGSNPQTVARKLGAALYQTLHSGRDRPLDVNLRTFRERAFDEALDEATGRRTTTVSGRVLGTDDDGTLVEIDGLRVRVPHSSVAEGPDDAATVVLPCARPGLSPGFFLASSSRESSTGGGPLLRLYGRLDDADAAPGVWRELVAFLEDASVPWRAKISSTRLLYPRNDAVVVYLPRPAWRVARPCAELLQDTGLLGEGVSPFTHAVTGSVGCAFEPDDKRPSRRDLSFGQHRTQIFAEALVRHAAQPISEQEPVTDTIAAAFVDAGIDPLEPARNLSSPVVDVLRSY